MICNFNIKKIDLTIKKLNTVSSEVPIQQNLVRRPL